MAILKKDLRAIQKDIKALERKMENLLKAFDKSKKAKAKPAVKKVATKVTKAKAMPVKRSAATKKNVKITATEQVLKIIRRSKKGVNVSAIKTRTGFDDKKVRNIIFRTTKEGKIRKIDRGVYVGA
jgi:hypothetical protein